LALAVLHAAAILGGGNASAQTTVERYRSFNVALNCPIRDMRRMASDPKYTQESFDAIHGPTSSPSGGS
jgi:hypothetical protein